MEILYVRAVEVYVVETFIVNTRSRGPTWRCRGPCTRCRGVCGGGIHCKYAQ